MSATATATGTQAGAQVSAPVAGTTGLDETVRTIIALAIGLGGLITIIAVWALSPVSEAEALSSVMTGLMGIVLGYYFGASEKAKSDKAADKAKTDADTAKAANAKALGKVAAAKGKLQVTGMSGGGVGMRAAVSGTPTHPVDAAIYDLDEAMKTLNPP